MNSAPDPGASRKARLAMRAAEPAELLIRSAFLLDPRAGLAGAHDVLVRDGRVAEVGPPGSVTAPPRTELIEGDGLHLFPAFVDPHVHLRVPGREDEEDLDSGTRAAAAGGFCAVLAMPNTDPAVDNAPVLRSLHERAGMEARVPVGFLAAATRGQSGRELTDMAELADEGAVGFTDDGVPIGNAGLVRGALRYQRLCGGVLALHEEDLSLTGTGVMHEGSVSTLLGLAGIPSVSESAAIERDLAIAGYEGGRIHLLHLSTAESVEAVERAKQAGIAATAEVTPHHLTLTAEAVRSLDPMFKMNPPLRDERDRLALLDGLRSGIIDCIATDHAPHSDEEKESPFEQAPMGVTGLETAFAALYSELVLPGTLALEVLIERLVAGAAVYGLETPSLEPGADANLCLVDLDARWTVGESGYESRSSNSCFAGRRLSAKVLVTVANGAVAFRDRSFAIRLAHEARDGGQPVGSRERM